MTKPLLVSLERLSGNHLLSTGRKAVSPKVNVCPSIAVNVWGTG